MTENNWKEKVLILIDNLKSSTLDERQEAAWKLHAFAEDKITEV